MAHLTGCWLDDWSHLSLNEAGGCGDSDGCDKLCWAEVADSLTLLCLATLLLPDIAAAVSGPLAERMLDATLYRHTTDQHRLRIRDFRV